MTGNTFLLPPVFSSPFAGPLLAQVPQTFSVPLSHQLSGPLGGSEGMRTQSPGALWGLWPHAGLCGRGEAKVPLLPGSFWSFPSEPTCLNTARDSFPKWLFECLILLGNFLTFP